MKRAVITLLAVLSLFAGVAGTATLSEANSGRDCDGGGRSGRSTPQACHKHCNQGVGNGTEGCDPGNSNHGDDNNSNDERGGTPGDPGRKGGHDH